MNELIDNYLDMSKELFKEFKDCLNYDLLPSIMCNKLEIDFKFLNHNLEWTDETNQDKIYLFNLIIFTCSNNQTLYYDAQKDFITKIKWNFRLVLLCELHKHKIYTIKQWNKFLRKGYISIPNELCSSYCGDIINKLTEGV